MTTNCTATIGAADLRTAAQAVVDRWDTPLWKDVPATAEYIGRLRAALAAGQATAAQAVVPAGWKLALPGGKHTDEWESARVGDYNRGWNDYRKAAVSALSKITSEDRVRDGWAKASQWLRNNYQDHPNIASLCDAMLVAANTLTPVIECTCKAEDMPFGGCCKAPQPTPSPAPAQPAAQQGAAYAALPTSSYAGRVYEEGFLIGTCPLYTADQMRAFADATHTLRASHGQASSQAGEYPALVCDYCGALTPDPWHSSGMLHGKMSKHIHSCDACAARVGAAVQQDAARESEYRRGYRHGYEQRDAEVRGAMA